MNRIPTYLAVAIVCVSFVGCGLIYIGRGTSDYSREDLLDNSNFHWVRDSSSSSDLFFETGSWGDHNVSMIKENADKSLVRILDLLHEPAYSSRINYFVVNDRSRMFMLIKERVNGRAFPKRNLICAIANDTVRALTPHEMFHVVSWNLWGPTQQWINEGMAVYADDSWWMQDLHPLAHYLQEKGKLIPLDSLTQEFRRFDDMITYPESGSFLKFLYETYGFENFKILWKRGFTAFCESVNLTRSQVEQNWKAMIGQYSTANVRYKIVH